MLLTAVLPAERFVDIVCVGLYSRHSAFARCVQAALEAAAVAQQQAKAAELVRATMCLLL
jgi:hypothetical protein